MVDGGAASRSASVSPGAITALLVELTRVPSSTSGWVSSPVHGDVVGRFEIQRELGRGGFGVVYEALDRELGRTVAFKAIRGIARTSAPDDLVLAEAESAARLAHPNIVHLYDLGRCEMGPYLILELLRGETLAARLGRGPLTTREALRVAVEVSRGLAHAHEKGVVHRDLKPGNVFLCDDGQVKVLDFGLATVFGRSDVAGGTPGYMAPEQRRGEIGDERVDVFALGVLVVEMLIGEPSPGGGEPRVKDPRERARPSPPTGLPPSLASVIERTIALDPSARLRDGRAVLEALLRVERSLAARRARARLAAWTGATTVAVSAAAWALANRPPAAPVVVAMADVVNETSDAELGALGGLLAASLEQSQHIRVVTRTRMTEVLRVAGKGNVERIDEVMGREAAKRTGSGALLLPTVRRFDDVYAIDLAALDPREGDRLFSVKVDGRGRDAVPALVDELARAVLRRIAGALAPAPRAVAVTATASLEAYHHYFRGQQLADQHRYDEAMTEFRRASDADPGFALARYQAARLGWLMDLSDEERQGLLSPVMENLDALRERERELVLGMSEELAGRYDEAIARYQRLAVAYPEDREPPYLVGESLFHRGRAEEAIPWYERALAIDPSWPLPLTHVVGSLPPEEAVARVRIAIRLFPGSGNHWALALALGHAGDREGAAQAARRMAEIAGTPLMRAYAIPFLVFAERLDEAEAEAHAIEGRVPLDAWPPTSAAGLLAYQGRFREGLALLPSRPGLHAARAVYLAAVDDRAGIESEASFFLEGLEKRGGRAPFTLRQVATALAEAGAVEQATRAARLLGDDPVAPVIEAAIAWKRGDPDEALAALRALDASAPDIASYFLGALCAATGRDEEAVAALRRYERVNHSEFLYRSWALPKALYLRARSHERLGQREEAKATLDRLLAMWRRADADLPLLAHATALRARLAARPSR